MPVFRDRRTDTVHSLVNGVRTDSHIRQRMPGTGSGEMKELDPARVQAYRNLLTAIFNPAAMPDVASPQTAFTPDAENPQVTTTPETSDDNPPGLLEAGIAPEADEFQAETDNDYLDSGDWKSNG